LVLVQVRFAPVSAVVREDFFAGFQQAVMEEYPLAQPEQEVVLLPGPDQAPKTTGLWRLGDIADEWRLTLAPGFVALESFAYPGSEHFFDRLRRALEAVEAHVRPPRVERLGVRYVCRITAEEDLERLPELVRPEVAGIASLNDSGVAAELSLTQSTFLLEGRQVSARWGILPPHARVDPAIRAAPERSWMLDIDVFEERKRPFDAEALTNEAVAHSRTQYRFFRWAVEPAFLLRFGASEEEVAGVRVG
jgi:uncharacterized protein (TIGR04255 family)